MSNDDDSAEHAEHKYLHVEQPPAKAAEAVHVVRDDAPDSLHTMLAGSQPAPPRTRSTRDQTTPEFLNEQKERMKRLPDGK
jgi:hypothetical protein